MKFFCLGVILLVVFAAWSRAEGGFDLGDALDSDPTPKPKEKPKAPVKPKSGGDNEFNLEDAFTDLDPKPDKPAGKPPKSGGDGGGFNLEDAIGGMDPKPDKPVDKPKSGGGGGGKFDDSDLFGIADEKPDPDGGRSGGGRAVDPGYDSTGGADQPQDPNLLWGGLLKMLNANTPEEVHVWISNLKQTVAPLLERALEMLRAIP